jgi:hypothetical protein
MSKETVKDDEKKTEIQRLKARADALENLLAEAREVSAGDNNNDIKLLTDRQETLEKSITQKLAKINSRLERLAAPAPVTDPAVTPAEPVQRQGLLDFIFKL